MLVITVALQDFIQALVTKEHSPMCVSILVFAAGAVWLLRS